MVCLRCCALGCGWLVCVFYRYVWIFVVQDFVVWIWLVIFAASYDLFVFVWLDFVYVNLAVRWMIVLSFLLLLFLFDVCSGWLVWSMFVTLIVGFNIAGYLIVMVGAWLVIVFIVCLLDICWFGVLFGYLVGVWFTVWLVWLWFGLLWGVLVNCYLWFVVGCFVLFPVELFVYVCCVWFICVWFSVLCYDSVFYCCLYGVCVDLPVG